MQLNKRISSISPSITLGISAKAKEMKANGVDVISFAAGEPDFDTPDFIKNAAKKALDEGKTGYVAVGGIPELKKEIVKKLKTDNGLDYAENEIIVSVGAKGVLFNILMALIDDGDEVLIPEPYWVSYPEMVKATGGVGVLVPSTIDKDFKITVADLEKYVTPKTKAIFMNSPSNPTGSVYSKAELQEIADYLDKKGIWVISDEIYEKILYDNIKHVSIASLNAQLKEKTIVVNGFSKSHAMTGWRLGYAAGNKDVIACATRLQGQSTSGATSFVQYAAVEGLKDTSFIEPMRVEFEKRRNVVVEMLNDIQGFKCPKPQGAFYVFPDISALFGKTIGGVEIKGSMDLAGVILEKAEVATVPGIGFGMDKNLRISFATSMDNIKEGLTRIKKLIEG